MLRFITLLFLCVFTALPLMAQEDDSLGNFDDFVEQGEAIRALNEGCTDDNQSEKCVRLRALRNCAGCAVAEAFLDGALSLSEVLSEEIGGAVRMLAVVGFAIWILFQTTKMLLPFGPLDRSQKQFNLIASKLGIMMIIVVGLQSLPVYERFLYATVDGVIGFSGIVLQTSATYSGQVADAVIESKRAEGIVDEDVERLDQLEVQEGIVPEGGVNEAGDGNATNEEMKQNMMDNLALQIALVQSNIAKPICVGMKIYGFRQEQCFAGRTIAEATVDAELNTAQRLFKFLNSLRKQAFATYKTLENNTQRIQRFLDNAIGVMDEFMLNTIASLLLISVYGLIWIKYPLALLDVVLRWAVILVLWPVMVISLAFPGLRDTTSTMLKGVANACLTLVFQAVIVGVIVSIVKQIMLGTDIAEFELIAAEDSGIANYLFQNGSYMMIIVSGFIMLHLMKQAPVFAGVFINSTMDTAVADGVWKQFTTYFWIAADATTGGATQARKVLPIK